MASIIKDLFKTLFTYFVRYYLLIFGIVLVIAITIPSETFYEIILGFAIPLLGIFYIRRTMKKKDLSQSCLKLPQKWTKEMMKDIVLVFGLDIGIAMATSALLSIFMDVQGNIDMAQLQSNFLLQIITTGLLIPIDEEFFFRGFLPDLLGKHSRIKTAIIISIFFGFAHMNVFVSISAFVTSMCLLALRYKYHSVWPGILVHMLTNVFNLTGAYLNPDSFGIIDILFICSSIYSVITLWIHKDTIVNEFSGYFKDSVLEENTPETVETRS